MFENSVETADVPLYIDLFLKKGNIKSFTSMHWESFALWSHLCDDVNHLSGVGEGQYQAVVVVAPFFVKEDVTVYTNLSV